MKAVHLKDIVDALYMSNEETVSCINKDTGEIHILETRFFEMNPSECLDWEVKECLLAQQIEENEDNYICLFDRYLINDYDIMFEFCSLLTAIQKDRFLTVIKGKGAFKRFRNLLIDENLEDKWYQFKDQYYLNYVKEWCLNNEVLFES